MSALVELLGGDTSGLLTLLGVGKALPREGISSEEPPPALLPVEPPGSGRNEDVVQARMRLHPGPRLQTVVTRESIRDEIQVAGRIVRFDVGEQCDGALGGA